MDQPYRLRRLDEEQRLETAVVHEGGNARRHAARTRRKADLPDEHFVIVLSHKIPYPSLQVGIGDVGDPICRLSARTVRNIRIGGIRAYRTGVAGNRHEIADSVPP